MTDPSPIDRKHAGSTAPQPPALALRETASETSLGDEVSLPRIADQARRLYASAPLPGRWIQRYRPAICPFELLIPHFSADDSVLDAGCGAGLLLGLLALNGRLRSGLGFDANEKAIGAAHRMVDGLPPELRPRLTFLSVDARAAWPEGVFNVVSLVDVMHHIHPAFQRKVFQMAAARVADRGKLVYKDMAQRPLWSAWANRLHDLAMVKEWIHYCPLREIRAWGAECGLTVRAAGRARRLWYTHEYIVFERAAGDAN